MRDNIQREHRKENEKKKKSEITAIIRKHDNKLNMC